MSFSLSNYLSFIETEIIKILNRPQNNSLSFDILDSDVILKNKLLVKKIKQYQMKIGEIFQMVLGNYQNFENLPTKNDFGVDIISYNRKIIVELKNRTNTDNNSSKITNYRKLAKFKKDFPEFKCIYGCINEINEQKTLNGNYKKIIIDSVEIECYTGYKLLKLILGDDLNTIIEFIKKIIKDYLNN